MNEKWKLASSQLRQSLPTDGLPILEDWLTVWEQMVFAGVDLAREPVDVSVPILEQLEMNISNQNSFCDKVQLAPGLTAASSRHFSVCWLMLVASTFAPNVVENTCQRTESWSQTFEHRHCEGLYEDPVHSIHFVAGQWFGACNSWGTAAARTLFCCPGQGLACSSSCNLAQMILLFEAPG